MYGSNAPTSFPKLESIYSLFVNLPYPSVYFPDPERENLRIGLFPASILFLIDIEDPIVVIIFLPDFKLLFSLDIGDRPIHY